MCKNPVFLKGTKHIDVRLHFIHNIVSQVIVKLEKILSKYNPSDMGTKVLMLAKFRNCLTLLNIGKGKWMSQLIWYLCQLINLFACVQALLGIKVEICWGVIPNKSKTMMFLSGKLSIIGHDPELIDFYREVQSHK